MDKKLAAATAIGVLSFAAACASAEGGPKVEQRKSPNVNKGAIVDAGPYWCWYMPQQAVRQITGLNAPLTEHRDGDWPTHGGCSLRYLYNRVGVEWSTHGGKSVLKNAHLNFDEVKLVDFPGSLGEGVVAYTGRSPATRPYYSIVWFRCGKKEPWIKIEMSEVAKGRSTAEDLIQLLRVSMQRYGKVHKCEPKPR